MQIGGTFWIRYTLFFGLKKGGFWVIKQKIRGTLYFSLKRGEKSLSLGFARSLGMAHSGRVDYHGKIVLAPMVNTQFGQKSGK